MEQGTKAGQDGGQLYMPGTSKEPSEQPKSNDKAEGGDHKGQQQSGSDDEARAKAARLIQSNYRGYRTRRELQGQGIDANTRWDEAFKHLRLDDARDQQLGKKSANGKSDASNRWKRGGLLVGQIAGSPCSGAGAKDSNEGAMKSDGPVEGGPTIHGEGVSSSEGSSPSGESGQEKPSEDDVVGDVPGGTNEDKIDNVKRIAKPNQHGLRMIEWWTRGAAAQDLSKVMEAAYWLEMVDKKHRYGSNLKPYHAAWSEADTKENFFVWLDEGEGKDVNLDDCPRDQLEKERIDYLSAEQRGNYVVDIREGKLYWRRNGKLVDTTRGKHKDLDDGRGIVELGEEEQEEQRRMREERQQRRRVSSSSSLSSMSSSSSTSSSDRDPEEEAEIKEQARHYGGGESKKSRRLGMLSSKGLMDGLLRKTIGTNTWIYVLNSRRELYVGIKQTGKFQHSSFLYGGRVLSAGLLKAKHGVLTSLSPLSGHYRAGTAHFRHFVSLLQQEGCDLEHVALSKSLLMLRGMEAYGKMTGKVKKGAKKNKKKVDKPKSSGGNGNGKEGDDAKQQHHHDHHHTVSFSNLLSKHKSQDGATSAQ